MKDFLAFRTMVTPLIIQTFFWVGVVLCVIIGLFFIVAGVKLDTSRHLYKGILILFLGPLFVRIYSEILIVFFRINETLTEIKHALEDRPPPSGGEDA